MGNMTFIPDVKRPGREADHSPPSGAELKNAWSNTSTPPVRLRGVVLSQAQGKLYILHGRIVTEPATCLRSCIHNRSAGLCCRNLHRVACTI